MAKKKAPKLRLIPEERLEPLREEVERLAVKSERVNDIKYYFRKLPYYHAIAYYVMFAEHLLLDEMREKLGGVDDATALANAYFWYRVVADWSMRIEPGSNTLEGEMEGVEESPGYFFPDGEDNAIWYAARDYVTRARRSEGAGKAAAARKRRAARAKAAQTKKRRAAGRKAAATRKAK